MPESRRTLHDIHTELLLAWKKSKDVAESIDKAKYLESRQLADLEVDDAQHALWSFRDDVASNLATAIRWLRESGRYDDDFAALIRDAVHDETKYLLDTQRGRVAKLEKQVEDLQSKLEVLLEERLLNALQKPSTPETQRGPQTGTRLSMHKPA